MNYQNQSFEIRISSDGFDFRNDKSDILMQKLKKFFFFNFMYISKFFNFRSFKPLFEKSSYHEKLLQKKN